MCTFLHEKTTSWKLFESISLIWMLMADSSPGALVIQPSGQFRPKSPWQSCSVYSKLFWCNRIFIRWSNCCKMVCSVITWLKILWSAKCQTSSHMKNVFVWNCVLLHVIKNVHVLYIPHIVMQSHADFLNDVWHQVLVENILHDITLNPYPWK